MTTPLKSYAKSITYILVLILLGLLISLSTGCSRAENAQGGREDFSDHNFSEAEYEEMPEAKNEAGQFRPAQVSEEKMALPVSSSAADASNDNGRLIARTARLKFRVTHLAEATLAIEDLAAANQGMVTYTHLRSEDNNHEMVPVSADSTLEVITFQVYNDMTIRVPNHRLDSTLRGLIPYIDHLDSRTITADDKTIAYLMNQLTQERLEKQSGRTEKAIDQKGKRLKHITPSEQTLSNIEAQANRAEVANLLIKQEVEYSTITLNLYTREQVRKTLLDNPYNVEAYEPGLGSKLLAALYSGWEVLKSVIIALAHSWALLLAIAVTFFVGRKYLRTKKS